jgi:hypothetical protein
LSSPHREALNQRNKKIERKRGLKTHPEKKSPAEKIFPRCFFLKRTQFFSRVFELPLPRNAQKRTKTKKYVRTFFGELAQMYVVFSFYFSCRPLSRSCLRHLRIGICAPQVSGPPDPRARPVQHRRQELVLARQGATEKIKRENDVHLRQLAKKSTYIPSLFLFLFFSAFLDVSRQGEFENTRKKIEYVSKKITGEIFFRGGIFFPGEFFASFSFRFFLLRWLSASR